MHQALPQVARIPQAVKRPHSFAAEQMARACGIPIDEAEGYILMGARRSEGIPE